MRPPLQETTIRENYHFEGGLVVYDGQVFSTIIPGQEKGHSRQKRALAIILARSRRRRANKSSK